MSQINKKDSGEFVDLSEVIYHYLKYWKWFVFSVLLCIAFGFLYLKYTKPIFKTIANIQIKKDDSKSSDLGGAAAMMKSLGVGGLAGSDNIDDEIEILSSHSLLKKMITKLELYKTYQLKKFPVNAYFYNDSPILIDVPLEMVDTLTHFVEFNIDMENNKGKVKLKLNNKKIGDYVIESFPSTIDTEIGSFTFRKNDKSLIKKDSYGLKVNIAGLDYMTEVYMGKVQIGAVSKKSNVISLNVDDENKIKGKDILNDIVKLYNEDALTDKNKMAKNTAKFIDERLDIISKELNTIELSIEAYKKKNKIVDVKTEVELFLEKMNILQEKSTEVEIQLSLINMIEEYFKEPKNKYSLIPSGSGLPKDIAEAINSYNTVALERTRLLRSTNEANPLILSINQQLDLSRENVLVSIQNVKKEFATTRKSWKEKENQVMARIDEMPEQEREYLVLMRQQKIKSELYIFLLQKMQETELTLASSTPKAKIIDVAYTVFEPISPKKVATLGMFFAFGLIIPIVIIYLRDTFKAKISDQQELGRYTSVPVLGEICYNHTNDRVVVTPTSTSPITELFRLIRTNIQFILTRKEEKVILITSSVSEEGKSFFVINFALSLSLIKNKKIVIVGLDIRKPKLTEYLSKDMKTGITSYLASDTMEPEEIIFPCSDLSPNLYIIPSGVIPPNPAELLLSDRLDELFVYLRKSFDYIVVDTAPVGMVSDTYSLDRVSDATIYLFRADFTDKTHLKLVDSIVKENKLKKVSLVLNGSKTKSGYGYGYGKQ